MIPNDVPVRSYVRRKPRRFVDRRERVPKIFDTGERDMPGAFPGVKKEEALPTELLEIEKEAKEAFEDERGTKLEAKAQSADVKVAEALVRQQQAQRGQIEEELKLVLKEKGDPQARITAKRLKADLRSQEVAIRRSKAALTREKGEAVSAKQAAKQAAVQSKIQKEELARQRMATRLERVEKRRSIEESREKLRLERMKRKQTRKAEKAHKKKAHKGRFF